MILRLVEVLALVQGVGHLVKVGLASLDGGNGLTGGAVNVVAGTGTSGNGGLLNLKQGGVQQEMRGMLY